VARVPAPKFKLEIKGARELELNLRSLASATGKRFMRQALIEAAEPVEKAMQTGALRLTGRTAESIGTQALPGVGAMGVTVAVGPSKAHSFKAVFGEFGTSRQPARPRYRAAWEGSKLQALAVLTAALRKRLAAANRRRVRSGNL
jgi:HK97 gp10 family phage protein